jgi:hypothetical protein
MTKSEFPAVFARMYTQLRERIQFWRTVCVQNTQNLGLLKETKLQKMDNIYSRLEIKLFAAFLSGENIC